MGRKIMFIFFLFGAVHQSCTNSSALAPPARYIIYVDSTSVYRYDLGSEKKETIYSFGQINRIFSSLKKYNDSIVSVSIEGGRSYSITYIPTKETTTGYSHEEFFDLYDFTKNDSSFYIVDTVHFYFINIYTGKVLKNRTDVLLDMISQVPIAAWTGKPIHPNVPEEGYHLTKHYFNSVGDTSKFYSYYRNRPDPEQWLDYWMESEFHNGRKVISSEGGLLLKTYYKTDTLRKYPGKRWDYWSRDGYFEPSLSHKGDKVVFRCLNGRERIFADGRVTLGDSGIYEINLNTRETKLVINRHYERPEYSPDDKYLLVYDHNAYLHNYTFHTYNLNTKEIKTIGEGNHCIWF